MSHRGNGEAWPTVDKMAEIKVYRLAYVVPFDDHRPGM
jgi:hypothetical protein